MQTNSVIRGLSKPARAAISAKLTKLEEYGTSVMGIAGRQLKTQVSQIAARAYAQT